MNTGINNPLSNTVGHTLIEVLGAMLLSLSLILLLSQQYYGLLKTQYEQRALYQLLDRVRQHRFKIQSFLHRARDQPCLPWGVISPQDPLVPASVRTRADPTALLIYHGDQFLYKSGKLTTKQTPSSHALFLYQPGRRGHSGRSEALLEGIVEWQLAWDAESDILEIQTVFDTPLSHKKWTYHFHPPICRGFVGFLLLPFLIVVAFSIHSLWGSARAEEKILQAESQYLRSQLVEKAF